MAFSFVNGDRKIARMSNCNSVVQWLLVVPKMCWNWCCNCSVMRRCLWLAPCFCGMGWRWIAYISKIDTMTCCFEDDRCLGEWLGGPTMIHYRLLFDHPPCSTGLSKTSFVRNWRAGQPHPYYPGLSTQEQSEKCHWRCDPCNSSCQLSIQSLIPGPEATQA